MPQNVGAPDKHSEPSTSSSTQFAASSRLGERHEERPLAVLDKFVDVGGLNLHYLDWGNKDKSLGLASVAGSSQVLHARSPQGGQELPVMLLVHGMTGNCHDWDGFAERVREDYHVLALDQPGHGDSDWSREGTYDTKNYLLALEGFVDKVIAGRFTYVGHSMGAHNGLAYAASHADKVERLVMVDFGPAREFPRQSWYQPPEAFDSEEEIFEWLKSGRETTPLEILREKAVWRTRRLPNGKYAFKHDPVVSERWDCQDLWSDLPKISCPTLIMRGGNSTSVTAEYCKRSVSSLARGQFVEIAGAGHSIMLDQIDKFTTAVSSFLKTDL
ncbi:MAG: alpha/beta hydrolase [Dehalococcoidia bacterium]|nr:alpha/beta hydrolase [Dehalococcoidia bacterium]